jgi:hypothetical protein
VNLAHFLQCKDEKQKGHQRVKEQSCTFLVVAIEPTGLNLSQGPTPAAKVEQELGNDESRERC